MRKIIFLGVLSLILVSCTQEEEKPFDPNGKVIYTLNKELTEAVWEVYSNIKNKEDYYIMLNLGSHCQGEDRYVVLEDISDDKKIEILVGKTHRFLRLEVDILVPIISDIDISYEEETLYRLPSKVGQAGTAYFFVNANDEVVEVRNNIRYQEL